MTRRRNAAFGFAAALVVGLALLAVAAVRPELLARHRTLDASSIVVGLLYAAALLATVGVWAETRGIVPAGSWTTRPAAAARAILAHLTGRSPR